MDGVNSRTGFVLFGVRRGYLPRYPLRKEAQVIFRKKTKAEIALPLPLKTNARLPRWLERPTLAGMRVGEIGYTVSWAMLVDSDRQCYLIPEYVVDDKPHGTMAMKILCTKDGYEVWPPSNAEYRPAYLGGALGLPVTAIHRSGEHHASD